VAGSQGTQGFGRVLSKVTATNDFENRVAGDDKWFGK